MGGAEMKRRIWALLVACALVGALCAGGIAAADVKVFQLALNDDVMDMSVSYMPIESGTEASKTMYVPYTIFEKAKTDLGVYWRRNPAAGTLTLYSFNYEMTFNLNNNTCADKDGNKLENVYALKRGDMIYVPVAVVCEKFGLSYTAPMSTNYGYLMRIKTSAAIYSDGEFLTNQTAEQRMRDLYNNYMANHTVSKITTTTPTTAPASPSSPAVNPQDSGNTSEGEEAGASGTLYLAIRCDTGESMDSILDILEASDVHALLLFPVEQLPQHAAQIRRATGSGHVVGLLLSDSTSASALLVQGKEQLALIAHLTAHTVYLPGAGSELTASLRGEGWYCWQTDIDAVPSAKTDAKTLAQKVMNQVEDRTVSRILMDDSELSANMLSRLLTTLRTTEYKIGLPVETKW